MSPTHRPPFSLKKKILFLFLPLLLLVLFVELGVRVWYFQSHSKQSCGWSYLSDSLSTELALRRSIWGNISGDVARWSGLELNRRAWEASFYERGIDPPSPGPREGYWGQFLPAKAEKLANGLRFLNKPVHLQGNVHIYENGLQHAGVPLKLSDVHLFILGGSVAFGAYASSEEKTYFAQLAQNLKQRGVDTHITVLATGGWLAMDEVLALHLSIDAVKPDAVLFFDGLNDLVNTQGSAENKTHVYLKQMLKARELLEEKKIPVIFSLQPFLLRKKHFSPLEKRILEVQPFGKDDLDIYEAMQRGLEAMAEKHPDVFAISCADVLNDERASSFADVWHFSDEGHKKVAERLAQELESVLKSIRKNKGL